MRKVLYALMVSLDGFTEGPNGDLSWSEPDEELHQHFNDLTRMVDVSLYGRRLYENMAAHWPTADTEPGATDYEIEFAQIWKQMPKLVFSTTLKEVAWNSALVREVIPAEIARLKEQPGTYIDVGGADLAATFMRLDLIDEYRLYVHPVVLGAGKLMFPALEKPLNLRFVESHKFGTGVVMLRYTRREER